MSTPSLHTWLASHRHRFEAQRRYWYTREVFWSAMRLITFFGIFASLFTLHENGPLCAAAMLLFALAFVVSIPIHRRRRDRRLQSERSCTVVDEAKERVGGRLIVVRSGERPSIDESVTSRLPTVLDAESTWQLGDQEFDDLDLYAKPTGIFGLLNRCSSSIGADRLRVMLERPILPADRLRERQSAVRWLAENGDARLAVMAGAAGLRTRDSQLHQLIETISTAELLRRPGAVLLLRIWSALTGLISIAALVLMFRNIEWFWVLGGIGGFNFILLLLTRDKAHQIMLPWRYAGWAAMGWTDASIQAAAHLPTETPLARLKQRFADVADTGRLQRLCTRLSWVDSGGPFYAAARVLMLYDLHVADALLKCVAPYRQALLDSLSAVADLEALTSLACFAVEQPVTCWPEIVTSPKLEVTGGRHPLIAPEHVVPNDLHLDEQTRMWIVTGSNMAGKSTYVRMVGISALLAQIGSTATAEAMTLSPVRLITDLRARDDIAKEESYFLAEVRQLRRMLFEPQDGPPLLALVDELFRGTNSEEQAAACHAVVRHMWDAKFFVLFATHERTLTDMADGRVTKNYHFRELLDGDRMAFDYQLRPGAAETRNALRVLQREGYPPTLLERAHAWLAERGHDDDLAR